MIEIKPIAYTVMKCEDKICIDEKDYSGIMTIVHITNKLCYVSLKLGNFNDEDYEEIFKKLLDFGYEDMFLETNGRLKYINIKKM